MIRLKDVFRFTFRYALLVAVFLLLTVSSAYARNWRIGDFHSTITVDEHGGATVMERITLVFSGSYNGIYRSIPIDYPGPRGTNYSLFLKVLGVTDDRGTSLKYDSHHDGH